MKKHSAFLFFLLIGYACFAQESAKKDLTEYYINESKVCGGMDSVLARNGSWKKVPDANVFPDKTFSRAQYKFATARMDSIYQLLKTSLPNLNGFEPRWYRSIDGQAYLPDGAVPYELKAFFLEYYCNTNYKKILLGDETGNWVKIFVNKLNWFLYEADTLDINNEGRVRNIFQLPPKIGQWKGYHVYELKISEWFTSRSIIIGRNGKLPWRSITQKQYLTGLKNKYEKQLKKFKEGSSYESDYTKRLKYINDYLAVTNEETLERVAVIDPNAGIWGFKGKFGDEKEGGFKLVLGVSGKYFDTSLLRYAPQLIQLYWSYGKSPSALHFKDQFEKNFPIEKLKAMIR